MCLLAEEFATEHGYEIDANRELLGLGTANAGVAPLLNVRTKRLDPLRRC